MSEMTDERLKTTADLLLFLPRATEGDRLVANAFGELLAEVRRLRGELRGQKVIFDDERAAFRRHADEANDERNRVIDQAHPRNIAYIEAEHEISELQAALEKVCGAGDALMMQLRRFRPKLDIPTRGALHPGMPDMEAALQQVAHLRKEKPDA